MVTATIAINRGPWLVASIPRKGTSPPMVKLVADAPAPALGAPSSTRDARASLERVVRVQGHRDLLGELARNPARLVDLGELFQLPFGIGGQLGDLGLPVCALHVGLR